MVTFRNYMADWKTSTVSENEEISSWTTDSCWVSKVKCRFGGHPGHVWVGFPYIWHEESLRWDPLSLCVSSSVASLMLLLWGIMGSLFLGWGWLGAQTGPQPRPWSHLTPRRSTRSPPVLQPPLDQSAWLPCWNAVWILLPPRSPGQVRPQFLVGFVQSIEAHIPLGKK